MNKNIRIYICSCLYGLGIGLIFNLYVYYLHDVEKLMPTRIAKLTQLLSLNFPDALKYLTEHPDHMTSYYLYQRQYGSIFGIDSPVDIMQQIWVWMFTIVFSIITVFSWYKYQSKKLTLFSPIIFGFLIKAVVISHHDDCTWFLAWAVYAILPFIIIFHDKCSFFIENESYMSILLITFIIAILIGISNVGRLHSGLAILLVLIYIIALFCHRIRDKKKSFLVGLLSALIMFNGYSLFTSTIPNNLMRMYGINSNINYFGPWHTLYIGLGWKNSISQLSMLRECDDMEAWKTDKNPKNIIYLDECADAFVKSKDSAIPYISESYFEVLKAEYMRILTENTGWVILNYVEKILVCICYVIYTQWRLLLIVSLIGLILKRKHILQLSSKYMYFSTMFIMCVNFIFGIIAIPSSGYLQGSMAALSIGMFFLIMDIFSSLLNSKRGVWKRR